MKRVGKLMQHGLSVAVAAAALGLAAGSVEAQCINKAGQGTNSTEEGAKSQAYEAVLQATDWGMRAPCRCLALCLSSHLGQEFAGNLTASAHCGAIAAFAPQPSNCCNGGCRRPHGPGQPQRWSGKQEAAAVVGAEPVGQLREAEQFAKIDAGPE